MVGPLVFSLLMVSIWRQIGQQAGWQQSIRHLSESFTITSGLQTLLVLLLMFVNWGIEAFKWQLALKTVEPISFRRSLSAIFSGTTMAFFTPNRIGEYFGRILFVKDGARISSVAFTIMCGTAQLLVTLVVGFTGLFFIRPYLPGSVNGSSAGFWIDMLAIVVLPVALMTAVFYFRLQWIVRWISRLPLSEKIRTYIEVASTFHSSLLSRILLLSMLRFTVFIVQYYFILQVFDVSLNWWQTFWSISVIFLVLAIIPSIALFTDLGIRWQASMQFLALFSTNTVGILGASLAIWIINLVLPAVIGSLLIFGIRIFNTRREEYLREVNRLVK